MKVLFNTSSLGEICLSLFFNVRFGHSATIDGG